MILVAVVKTEDSLVLLVKILTVVQRIHVFRSVRVKWDPKLVFLVIRFLVEHHSLVELLAALLERWKIRILVNLKIAFAVDNVFHDFTERILFNHPSNVSISWLFTEQSRLCDVTEGVVLCDKVLAGLAVLHDASVALLDLRSDK